MPRLKRKRRLTEKFLLVILLRVSSLKKEREERYFFYILNVISSNWGILLHSYKSMIGIISNPNSLGTHIHLAAERGAKGPTFPLPWVYINKNTNISSYQSVKNISTDMSLFCLSPLYLFLYFNDLLLASQLPTCRCVEIVQLVSAAC